MKILVNYPRTKKAVFDTFFTEENIKLAESLGEVVWNDTDDFFRGEVLCEKIKDCDVYVTVWGSPALTEDIVEAAPKLKLLCHLCGTVVPFVSDAMWDRGIKCICGNNYFAESVAEGTISYMLTSLRDIPRYLERLRDEKIWADASDWTESLMYKTIGVVSYGAIAKHLIRLLKPFKVKLKVYDIVDIPQADKDEFGIEQVSLEEVFSSCEIITVHTPLNDKTRHLVDDRLLSLIPKGTLFVNTSRGGVIDQEALTKHLVNGDFNAFLDVLEKEPIAPDDPLLSCKNVKIMPHKAGPTLNLRKVITHDLLIEAHNFVDSGMALKPQDEITKERAEMMSRS